MTWEGGVKFNVRGNKVRNATNDYQKLDKKEGDKHL